MLTANWRTSAEDGFRLVPDIEARVEPVPTGMATPIAYPRELQGATFDRDHKRVLTFGRDRYARLSDATTGAALLPPVEHLSLVQSAMFSPDGGRFATVTAAGRVRVWSTDTGDPLTPPLDHNVSSGPIEFSASGRFLFAIHPAHAVYVWDLFQANEPPVLLRPDTPDTLAESGLDGSVFVTRAPNSPIRVRATADASAVSLHPSSLKAPPVQAWFDQTGQFIILEGEEQHAQIWDAATGLPVTPAFRSHYATNDTDYLNIRFAELAGAPQLPAPSYAPWPNSSLATD